MAAIPLQAARQERGWTQSQVIARMRRAADEQLASDGNLMRQLSRWENGGQVSKRYQTIFCRV
ncbi:transcriptional regulator with XRE-family HTH domain [Spinactinospora alkalitolerans]|uniref:Transcriptional regulator with XRE-family HTH domain n=1 Tax=Spinactinospora alkalitolerans TaxID=687207 RepID=A0A852TTR9_9ACTN|nr:hypothetical protein [Spinactinospora alkalitolerans]NYE46697.1 transcriptional regulator with XRE-family HTH domain [Spinactinospora alkalitolerans]